MTNQTEKAAPSSEEMQRIAGYRKNNQWADLQKHLTYQLQETIEQVTAFNERNEEDFRDASGDIRVLLDAQKASVTYSLDADYNEIVEKLFTRLDDTLEGAEKTQAKYAALGVATYIVHDERTGQFINRVSETVDGTDGEHYPKDKWLKSYKFQTPTFELVGLQDDREVKPTIQVVKNAGTTMFIGSEEELIKYAVGLMQSKVTCVDLTGLDPEEANTALGEALKYANAMADIKNETIVRRCAGEPISLLAMAVEGQPNTYTVDISIASGDTATLNLMSILTATGTTHSSTDYIEEANATVVSPADYTESAIDTTFNGQTGEYIVRSRAVANLGVRVTFKVGNLNPLK